MNSRAIMGKNGKSKAIVVDIDGTLADMRGVRGPFEWDKVGDDKPHEDIIELVQMYNQKGYFVIVVSGRDACCKKATKIWLQTHNVPFHNLYMRPLGDVRRDALVKFELYNSWIEPYWDVHLVIDDRQQTVDMWREYAELRCLQVAPGNF